ncbi:bifunctional metallophosphatase/5'-nucleotidase [Bacillus sp. FJAT-45066]|uniref:bifunctional metallophosphatase/5'-nucleotidase n=1 Tax=Bacillus sp. FJAT-45066 TaxID=2011010 RepID=UPI000BB71275|nr:bifunctional UDP-sugar hydrolase/5'-nucleotidase [Bacillus sp. FJAT-45066]
MNKLTLTILETSDIHGSVMPINYGNNEYAHVGLAKVSTLVARERKNNKHVVLIDNGDVIQGTPLTYHYAKTSVTKLNPMIKVLNELNFDAAIIGNHEFNYGMDLLNNAVKQSKFPWLSSNILDEVNEKPYFGKPYLLKDYDGVKVAILGVTTHYIPNWENPNNIVGLTFEDALQSTKQWVEKIRLEEAPDVLIVSYHGGFERHLSTGEPTEVLTGENQAYELCQLIEGIDVLLTGHQHRTIAETTVNDVLVLQPGVNGQFLGKATISFEKVEGAWKILSKNAELLSIEGVQEDPAVLESVKDYEQATQSWLDQPMGTIKGNMLVNDAMEIRTKDNPLIEFINKVQMDISDTTISNTALFHNGSPGFPENVTMRDIVSNYIYPNTLKVIEITGQEMKDALERCASYFLVEGNGELTVNPAFTTPKPQHYNYDMWEGIEYTLDIRKPIGSRVVQLEKDGAPLKLNETFHVVMNNYRAGGGGDYHMYKGKKVVKDITLDMSELIANYILKHKEIEATTNNNWMVIWK